MSQTWFTSDHHFGHKNIIAFCDRPFRSVAGMDEALIGRWNARIAPDDEVFYLGDFSFYNREATTAILARLNGHKILIAGNHDHKQKRMLDCGFDEYYHGVTQRFGANETVCRLAHSPQQLWEDPEADTWEVGICGHVHNLWKVKNWSRHGGQTLVNVGVDVWGYNPITWEQIEECLR